MVQKFPWNEPKNRKKCFFMKWEFFFVSVNSSVYQICFNTPMFSLLLPYYGEKENLSPFGHLGPGYFCHLSHWAQRWAQNPSNFVLSPQLCWSKRHFVAFSFLFFGCFFFGGGCAKNTGKTFFLVAVASVFFLGGLFLVER